MLILWLPWYKEVYLGHRQTYMKKYFCKVFNTFLVLSQKHSIIDVFLGPKYHVLLTETYKANMK